MMRCKCFESFIETELCVQNKQEAPRRQSSNQNAGAGREQLGGLPITAHPLPRLEPAPGGEQVGQWLEQVEWDLTSPREDCPLSELLVSILQAPCGHL